MLDLLRTDQAERLVVASESRGVPAVRRAVPGRAILIIVAATAGCQMTGTRPIKTPVDDLSVDRFYQAKFNAVKIAVEDIMHNHEAMHEIAGFDYSQGVTTSSWSWSGLFHMVANRDLLNLDRTVKVKVEQMEAGCLVTVRLSTGDEKNDLVQSGKFLDRMGEAVVMSPGPAGGAAPAQ